jgi:hypothetical protein
MTAGEIIAIAGVVTVLGPLAYLIVLLNKRKDDL